MIEWTSDSTFELAGTQYLCDLYGVHRSTEPTRFCLAKPRPIVERYAAFLADLAPKTIIEVGILEGASTALFADLTQPHKLVAIDYDEAPTAKLRDFIARRGLEEVVSVHGGVDQADVPALQRILDTDLGDADVDLVIDDASHRLDPSRVTFNLLFPRLRPGGAYILEDWATGLRAGGPADLASGERPLVELVYEAIALKGRHPTVVADITVKAGWTIIERGHGAIDDPFDVTAPT